MTFIQFKEWLTTMIVEKGGTLPDYDDWKEIKTKLDSVTEYDEVDKAYLTNWTINGTTFNPNKTWGVTTGMGDDFSVSYGDEPDPVQFELEFEPVEHLSDEEYTALSYTLGAELQQIIDEEKNNGKKEDS